VLKIYAPKILSGTQINIWLSEHTVDLWLTYVKMKNAAKCTPLTAFAQHQFKQWMTLVTIKTHQRLWQGIRTRRPFEVITGLLRSTEKVIELYTLTYSNGRGHVIQSSTSKQWKRCRAH
jgi:hypothetical protein